jgi:outer membrane protein assembly factor BamD (BamD/ComL family)
VTHALVLVAVLLLSACSTTTTTTWTRISSSMEASRLIREANIQLHEGNPKAATRILEDAVRRFPDTPSHDQALYDLARALVLSANGGRDYRQASAHLDRLLREYPTSRYTPDARALRIALGAYVARSAELDRLLERLNAIDLEYERPRQP